MLGKPQLDLDPALQQDDILFIEQVMVRAWLYHMAYIPIGQHDILTDFAYDVASGMTIDQMTSDYVHWDSLPVAWEGPLPGREEYPGVNAIYTALAQEMPDDPAGPAIYAADNLTHVSTDAAAQVLQEVKARMRREEPESSMFMDPETLLSTELQLHIQDGESTRVGRGCCVTWTDI